MTLEELLKGLGDAHLIGLFKESASRAGLKKKSILVEKGVDPGRAERLCYTEAQRLNDEDERGVLRTCVRQGFHKLSAAVADELIAQYEAKLALPRPPRPPRGPKLSEIIGVSVDDQPPFKAHALGNYLIFRLVKSKGLLLVSRMRVQSYTGDDALTLFATVRAAGSVYDQASVKGIMYADGDQIFAIGRIHRSAELRSTLLQKFKRERRTNTYDLAGIRLGLGVLQRNPRAYRIWCYKLERHRPKEVLSQLARDHSLDKLDLLRSEVSNLDQIVEFLEAGDDTDLNVHGRG